MHGPVPSVLGRVLHASMKAIDRQDQAIKYDIQYAATRFMEGTLSLHWFQWHWHLAGLISL